MCKIKDHSKVLNFLKEFMEYATSEIFKGKELKAVMGIVALGSGGLMEKSAT